MPQQTSSIRRYIGVSGTTTWLPSTSTFGLQRQPLIDTIIWQAVYVHVCTTECTWLNIMTGQTGLGVGDAHKHSIPTASPLIMWGTLTVPFIIEWQLYIPHYLKFKNTIFCPRTVATCFVRLSEKERSSVHVCNGVVVCLLQGRNRHL